jgi:hypothetical protein
MNTIDELIDECQQKLNANVIKMQQLEEASRILSIKINNLTYLVYDKENY